MLTKQANGPGGRSHIFDDWLRSTTHGSSSDYVLQHCEEWAQGLLDLADRLPPDYGWRVTTPRSLKQELRKAQSSADSMNAVYWTDVFRSVEAYGVLSVWRGTELLRAAVPLLNDHQVLAPAVISRALLELSVSFLMTANDIVDIASKAMKTPSGGLAASTELEEIVLSAIYGSRRPGTPKHLKAQSIIKYIDFLTQAPGASELKPVYEYLCDIAHPNTLGNARFAAVVIKKHGDGSETLRLERRAEAGHSHEIRTKTLWAVGWAAYTIRSGFQMNQSATKSVLSRWSTRTKHN